MSLKEYSVKPAKLAPTPPAAGKGGRFPRQIVPLMTQDLHMENKGGRGRVGFRQQGHVG